MTVTFLAIAFLVLILVVAFLGLRLVGRHPDRTAAFTERCSLCQNSFPPSQLIERSIGDAHVYRFCGGCIRSLHSELLNRN
jgi:hypothetical protein